jgi:uncharacterized protein YdaU (DUF1376 family)
MSARPWYKRYGGDFVFGTMSLSLEEKGAYSLCLDLIYDRGGPIPDDARWLAGVCGVSVRKWHALRETLLSAGKLTARDGFLTNDRAEREIEISTETSRKLAENGAKGGIKSAEKSADSRNINDLGQARLEPIQKPEPEDTSEAKASSVGTVSKSRTAEPRGSRIPDDWTLDAEGLAYAVKEGLPEATARREAEKFRDFWRNVPGAKARKISWKLTWETWVRTAAERLPRIVNDRQHPPQSAKLTDHEANLARAFAGSERAAVWGGQR